MRRECWEYFPRRRALEILVNPCGAEGGALHVNYAPYVAMSSNATAMARYHLP